MRGSIVTNHAVIKLSLRTVTRHTTIKSFFLVLCKSKRSPAGFLNPRFRSILAVLESLFQMTVGGVLALETADHLPPFCFNIYVFSDFYHILVLSYASRCSQVIIRLPNSRGFITLVLSSFFEPLQL